MAPTTLPVCSVVALGAKVIAIEKLVGMPFGSEMETATTSHTLRQLRRKPFTLRSSASPAVQTLSIRLLDSSHGFYNPTNSSNLSALVVGVTPGRIL